MPACARPFIRAVRLQKVIIGVGNHAAERGAALSVGGEGGGDKLTWYAQPDGGHALGRGQGNPCVADRETALGAKPARVSGSTVHDGYVV